MGIAMKVAEIKALLWDIAKRYPRVQGLLKKQVQDETQGQIWALDLYHMELDSGYLQDVCEEYATLKKDLPHPIDNLVKEIADEVKRRQYQDQRRLDLHMQASRPKAGELMSKVKDDRIGKIAIELGVLCKGKHITKKENDLYMNQLIEFDKGERVLPEFLVESEDRKLMISL